MLGELQTAMGAAAQASQLLGLPKTTGPLMLSCYGCLCQPLLRLMGPPKGLVSKNEGRAELAKALETYTSPEEQQSDAIPCSPCPEVLAKRLGWKFEKPPKTSPPSTGARAGGRPASSRAATGRKGVSSRTSAKAKAKAKAKAANAKTAKAETAKAKTAKAKTAKAKATNV